MAITKRLRITGLVQGVFYRESMRRRANQLGMTGWVRNRADG
ncbi:MAG: acylphosphatase [Burkholderiales bacterium]